MGKIEFDRITKAPVFRKIAFGSWKTVGDPSVYGSLDIDVKKAILFLENLNEQHSTKVTVSHLVAKALSIVLKKRPEINGMIRLGGIYQRKNIDLFFQVNVPGKEKDSVKGASLAGTVVRNVDKLSLLEIADDLQKKSARLRANEDNEFNQAVSLFHWTPWWMSRWLLDLTSFLNYTLNLNLSFLGIPKDPFGSAMITNVGNFGIEQAWAPLVPYSRVPLLLTLGAIREKPWVENGELCIRPILSIGVTFDHRFMDGVHASSMVKKFKECFAEPEKYFI